MNDSRERFEAWTQESRDQLEIYTNGALKGEYCDLEMQYAWRAWQAAEHEAARRCAEIAGKLADEYRTKYKGMTVDSVRRGGSYDPHDDGMSDGAAVVEDAIRTEFSEAFE